MKGRGNSPVKLTNYLAMFVCIIISILLYSHYLVVYSKNQETDKLKKAIQDLKSEMQRHMNSNIEGEQLIYKKLEDVAEAQEKRPQLEGKFSLSPAFGSKQLNATVTVLQSTYVDLLKKIEYLEEAVGSLKIKAVENEFVPSQKDSLGFVSSVGLRGSDIGPRVTSVKTDAFPDAHLLKTQQMEVVNVVSGHPLGMDTVLLIICSNRPDYLERTLANIVKYHPRTAVPVIVSEDGRNARVGQVIAEASNQLKKVAPDVPFLHWHHPGAGQPAENGYIKLASHFKWALGEVFRSPSAASPAMHGSDGATLQQIQRVIILEEDLDIAPDFFEFFGAVKSMLDSDNSLLAASAWHDNGQLPRVRDPKRLVRSDFFPGLGWMMPKRIWDELEHKWPRGYWDDWLREPGQRKGRHIIRPEICRTYHFGVRGVSNAQFSDMNCMIINNSHKYAWLSFLQQYLTSIKLNDEFVPFTTMDLSYLELRRWDEEYLSSVLQAPLIDPESFQSVTNGGPPEIRVEYTTLETGRRSFVSLAHWAGTMDNIKAGVPRCAYRGIVSTWMDGVKVHITPSVIPTLEFL